LIALKLCIHLSVFFLKLLDIIFPFLIFRWSTGSLIQADRLALLVLYINDVFYKKDKVKYLLILVTINYRLPRK